MGTTGAPWNIPFVEPTDIPRTYPEDSEDLALAIAAGLSAAGNAGIGSNVVSAIKTNTFSTTSNTYVDVPDLSVTITPTSESSKVLVIATLDLGASGTSLQTVFGRLLRNSTAIAVNASDATVGFEFLNQTRAKNTFAIGHLDTPSTTSAVTYKWQLRSDAAGTAFVNNSSVASSPSVSSITVIEVEG